MDKIEKSKMPFDEVLPSLMRSNMLRMVLTKHIELNKAADMKANMLMTAASIIIAIIVSTYQKTENITGLSILLISSLLAVIFAILVIIPKPYHKNSKCRHLLYFRSFRELSEDEYLEEMTQMMQKKKDIYEQYIRDIYQYGSKTLTIKYRLLTTGLILFILGLAAGGAQIAISLIQ